MSFPYLLLQAIEEIPAYGITKLIADVGGASGLYLGKPRTKRPVRPSYHGAALQGCPW